MHSTHKIYNYMYNLRKIRVLSLAWALHFKWDMGKQNQPKISKALEGRINKLRWFYSVMRKLRKG